MILNFKFGVPRQPDGLARHVVYYGFVPRGQFVPPVAVQPLTDTIENMKNPVNCVLIGHQQPNKTAIGLEGIPSSMEFLESEMTTITTSAHLGPSRDTNPAAPGTNKGPDFAATTQDRKLPSGKSIGETSDAELRTALDALGIEGAHRDGRNVIVERYARMLENFKEKAGNDAISAFLQANR